MSSPFCRDDRCGSVNCSCSDEKTYTHLLWTGWSWFNQTLCILKWVFHSRQKSQGCRITTLVPVVVAVVLSALAGSIAKQNNEPTRQRILSPRTFFWLYNWVLNELRFIGRMAANDKVERNEAHCIPYNVPLGYATAQLISYRIKKCLLLTSELKLPTKAF